MRTIVPAYLTEVDHPWLRALLDERERFVGMKRGQWKQRVNEGLPLLAPRQKLRTALRVLDRLAVDEGRAAVAPPKLRAFLFREAARAETREGALRQAASAFAISAEEVLVALFADLPDERRLTPLVAAMGPTELALRCNAELITGLLSRALRVRVVARGRARAVVRHAKLMGLLCHVAPGATADEMTLEISGPFALFRHSRLYARALASLLPRLAWCERYRLEADCVFGASKTVGRLFLGSGDPIAPARELAPFDSALEERFAKELAKLAPDWDLTREPRAIAAGPSLIFPDFELVHRSRGQRWVLEIVGYWTPEYLERKLRALRDAGIERLIVCVDEGRGCAAEALPASCAVVRFRRRLDPRAVLAIVDPGLVCPPPTTRKRRRGEGSA